MEFFLYEKKKKNQPLQMFRKVHSIDQTASFIESPMVVNLLSHSI